MSLQETRAPFEVGREGEAIVLRPRGAWVLENAGERRDTLGGIALEEGRDLYIDLKDVDRLDTAGAYALARFANAKRDQGLPVGWRGLSRERRALIERVEKVAVEGYVAPRPRPPNIVADIGATTLSVVKDTTSMAAMIGGLVSSFALCLVRPQRFRFGAMVKQMEMAGVRALPIVLLMSFIIGAILAQQSAFQLRFFGAEIYVVDLVGILSLREISVVLTAVMIAGRSGSAITAELGSMQMREEVDALRVIGMNPIEVLVLPRVLALLVMVPLLTFCAALATLFGAALMVWAYVDISPQIFIVRLRDAIDFSSLFSGLIKAPFMGLIIAVIACVEGLAVRGSAESLGRHTTASVVKAIFMVVVVDGIFAVFYAAINF